MNKNNQPNTMHFKSAQISGLVIGPTDMEKINKYALAPLVPESIFAFKVVMAANEIDRDFEVFPRKTLSELAELFVGKTVVKDHEHKSDNQIARIYATELIGNKSMPRTKNQEVYTQLIAKCYMAKTSANVDLISEIQAGIRKEVSLGCRIGKATCSICGTDNVQTYCVHFGGKEYDGKTCYFSLEDPQDAYELSFVAIPAQQHAGTVKSYGKEPCYKSDMEAREKAIEEAPKILHTKKEEGPGQEPLTVQDLAKEARRLMVNHQEGGLSGEITAEKGAHEADSGEHARKTAENAPNTTHIAPNEQENAPICADCAPNEPQNAPSEQAENTPYENLQTREAPENQQEEETRLTINRAEENSPEIQPINDAETSPNTVSEQEKNVQSENLQTRETLEKQPEDEGRLTVNRSGNHSSESQQRIGPDAVPNAASEEGETGQSENLQTRETLESQPEEENRLTVNQGEAAESRLTVNRASESDSDDSRLMINREEGQQQTQPEARSESCPQESCAQEPEPVEHSDCSVPHETPGEQPVEIDAEAEKALKAKQAEARLRALDLAISLRQHNNI